MGMELGQIVDTIFSVDKNIRYVGVVGPGPDYEIKESRMREGVKSLTREEKDREFVQVIPEFILGLANKLEDELGKVRYSLLCFQKLTLMLFKTPQYVVVLSLEAGTFARPIFDRITHLLSLDQPEQARILVIERRRWLSRQAL
jgi:hypothetical protein